MKSPAFSAVRSAIVPTQTISSAPCERAKSANFTTACAVRAIAASESLPSSRIPSPSLVITLTSKIIFMMSSCKLSPIMSFTELVPISITAFFIFIDTSLPELYPPRELSAVIPLF